MDGYYQYPAQFMNNVYQTNATPQYTNYQINSYKYPPDRGDYNGYQAYKPDAFYTGGLYDTQNYVTESYEKKSSSPITRSPSVRSSNSDTSTSYTDQSSTSIVSALSSLCVDIHKIKEPTFWDAFKIMYLEDQIKVYRGEVKYLEASKKKANEVEKILKHDRFGSKRFIFYPRKSQFFDIPDNEMDKIINPKTDNRVKIRKHLYEKIKNSEVKNFWKKREPVCRLKRWEVLLYKNLGFLKVE